MVRMSQDQQAVPMDTDEQQAKRTLSHWSTEEKEAFLACFKVRMPSQLDLANTRDTARQVLSL